MTERMSAEIEARATVSLSVARDVEVGAKNRCRAAMERCGGMGERVYRKVKSTRGIKVLSE